MRKKLVALLVLLVGILPAEAGYTVKVTKVPGFTDVVGTIAVLPANCPPQVDCVQLDVKIAEALSRYSQIRTIDSKKISQAMLELGLQNVGEHQIAQLAEKVGADSVLIIQIPYSGVEAIGWYGQGQKMKGTNTYSMYGGASKVSKGALEVRLVSAQTGRPLMVGKGFAKSGWRKAEGVLVKTFRKILEEAFGKPPKQD